MGGKDELQGTGALVGFAGTRRALAAVRETFGLTLPEAERAKQARTLDRALAMAVAGEMHELAIEIQRVRVDLKRAIAPTRKEGGRPKKTAGETGDPVASFSRAQIRRQQDLADVPDEVVEHVFEQAAEAGEVPSERELIEAARLAREAEARRKARTARSAEPARAKEAGRPPDVKGLTVLVGDCRKTLRTLPAGSVDCVVTSPPYFFLRDYGLDGQIGREPSLQEYVGALVDVFAEVYRVLKPTGTVWLNLGDGYAGSAKPGSKPRPRGERGGGLGKQGSNPASLEAGDQICPDGMKPKDLMMIPARVAIALQEWGWWLRSEVVWGKPNAMPSSATDRPTLTHEKVFLLTRQGSGYHYDYEASALPRAEATAARSRRPWRFGAKPGTGRNDTDRAYTPFNADWREREQASGVPKGHDSNTGFLQRWEAGEHDSTTRRLRSYERAPPEVWEIGKTSYRGAHFATFPPELVARCLAAGCPEGGVVLDPFAGAGTTGLVALQTGRSAVLCELNAEYADIARRRAVGGGGRCGGSR